MILAYRSEFDVVPYKNADKSKENRRLDDLNQDSQPARACAVRSDNICRCMHSRPMLHCCILVRCVQLYYSIHADGAD